MQELDRRTRHAIANRYTKRTQRIYVRGKLALDPVYGAVAQLLAEQRLPLLDIGCGIGLLAHYLDAFNLLDSYVGLDHDARKIASGRSAAARGGLGKHVQMLAGDAAAMQPLRGHVALLDILHYLPKDRQPALLQHAVRHLAPRGRLVIRNVLREPNWRFHATRAEEFFLRTSGWIPGGAQHYPSPKEIREPLENAGLRVDQRVFRGRFPYNSYLLIAHRPPA